MTNPTPHGQVPEALRLAEEISNLVCSSEAAAKTIAAAADELCRLHVENASLRAALAASPTPPAEQQVASSAVLKAIHEANMQLVRTGDDAFMLVPYKVATVEQQAAPKAAPGEPSAFPMTGDEEESDLGQWQPGTAKPNMDGTYLREFDEGEATSEFHQGVWLRDGFFPSDLQDVRWRGRAAPQQEAQEPATVPYQKLTDEIDLILSDPDTELSIGAKRALLWVRTWVSVPLYAAPQPAPAPLSDDVVKDAARYRWLIDQHWIQTEVEWRLISTDQDSTIRQLDAAIDAALAAQGGKDAG